MLNFNHYDYHKSNSNMQYLPIRLTVDLTRMSDEEEEVQELTSKLTMKLNHQSDNLMVMRDNEAM